LNYSINEYDDDDDDVQHAAKLMGL